MSTFKSCNLHRLGLCPDCNEQQRLEDALAQWEMLQELMADDMRGVSK